MWNSGVFRSAASCVFDLFEFSFLFCSVGIEN